MGRIPRTGNSPPAPPPPPPSLLPDHDPPPPPPPMRRALMKRGLPAATQSHVPEPVRTSTGNGHSVASHSPEGVRQWNVSPLVATATAGIEMWHGMNVESAPPVDGA